MSDLCTHTENLRPWLQQPIVFNWGERISNKRRVARSTIFDACAWSNFPLNASKPNGALANTITMINAGRLGTLRADRKVCCLRERQRELWSDKVSERAPQPTRDSRTASGPRAKIIRGCYFSSLLAWLPLLTTNWVGARVNGTCPASQSKAQSIRHPHSRLSLIHMSYFFILSLAARREMQSGSCCTGFSSHVLRYIFLRSCFFLNWFRSCAFASRRFGTNGRDWPRQTNLITLLGSMQI